jgi:transcriptional regulator with XRE-family HTH domain
MRTRDRSSPFPEADFATRLRWWRQRRGWSQLELAGRAEISQRHLSFLEIRRAFASRDMVARLATTLDLSLRQQNELLVAAGFAPVWHETELAAPELARVRNALDYMMAQQEPFPAVVVDRRWNLLKANQGAIRLVEFLVGPSAPDAPVNLADALVGPDVFRPFLVNWAEVVRYFIRSIEADAAADGTAETAAPLDRLLSYARSAAITESTPRQQRRRSGAADELQVLASRESGGQPKAF